MPVAAGHTTQARGAGDILEGPVASVAKQAIAGPSALRLGRERATLDQVDVEPIVAIEVDESDAAARRNRRDEPTRGGSILLDE